MVQLRVASAGQAGQEGRAVSRRRRIIQTGPATRCTRRPVSPRRQLRSSPLSNRSFRRPRTPDPTSHARQRGHLPLSRTPFPSNSEDEVGCAARAWRAAKLTLAGCHSGDLSVSTRVTTTTTRSPTSIHPRQPAGRRHKTPQCRFRGRASVQPRAALTLGSDEMQQQPTPSGRVPEPL